MLRTDRLLLRPWRAEDREPFAALNADPVVMEHFPSRLTREESDQFADSIAAHLDEEGWGTYAVEVVAGPGRGGVAFIGYVGLAAPDWLGATEVRWRLAREHWGLGYATEGAHAALADGFERLSLVEIVAITVSANERSRAVMRRLGMTHDPADDFDHPYLPEGHALRRHVKYRLRRGDPLIR
jgi:RimJ/RimL family protein N-acetyltransferase